MADPGAEGQGLAYREVPPVKALKAVEQGAGADHVQPVLGIVHAADAVRDVAEAEAAPHLL